MKLAFSLLVVLMTALSLPCSSFAQDDAPQEHVEEKDKKTVDTKTNSKSKNSKKNKEINKDTEVPINAALPEEEG